MWNLKSDQMSVKGREMEKDLSAGNCREGFMRGAVALYEREESSLSQVLVVHYD